MIESENMRHKKNMDHSLLKIHNLKDIVIHAKKDPRNHALSQKDELKVPKAMEPAGLMETKDKKSEFLPVHADMKKVWVPNEDGILDEQYKDAPTLAKLKHPQHSPNGKNTTEMTIIPDSTSKIDGIPSSSLT